MSGSRSSLGRKVLSHIPPSDVDLRKTVHGYNTGRVVGGSPVELLTLQAKAQVSKHSLSRASGDTSYACLKPVTPTADWD